MNTPAASNILACPPLNSRAMCTAPYAPAALPGPIDLWLDANEGPEFAEAFVPTEEDQCAAEYRHYPDVRTLEVALARRLGVSADRVLVTAGGDDAIDRLCRVCLEEGREMVLPVPTFEMIARSARQAGGRVIEVDWRSGAYPVAEVVAAVTPRTSLVVVVSPNNPTGAVATADELQRLASDCPGAWMLVDLAYTEFADEDLTAAAAAIPSAVIVRTFSKLFGLAGLRVGYAVGDARVIRAMRAAGSPYPVAGPSLRVAERALEAADERLRVVRPRIRNEREELASVLRALGAQAQPSEGNFVLGQFADAGWVWRALGGLGIATRRFVASELRDALRITCPCDEAGLDRLVRGLQAAVRPEGILLDMDGVLADVSGSYRRAIVLTAKSFGVEVTPEQICAFKARGNANNDWAVTQGLLREAGVEVDLAEVTRRFEELYLGARGRAGLRESERLIPSRRILEQLEARIPLGIVTGRPRRDARWFLERFDISHLFRTVVCMEDAPIKPNPAPVRLAIGHMNIRAAWMVGDTNDDVVAARGAGVVPIGFLPPGANTDTLTLALERAGAARVLTSFDALLEMLP